MTNASTTVGLIGASGLLGSALFSALSSQDNIKLVVLHRPTSKLDVGKTETRVLDLAGSESDIHKALKGIDVLVNATGKTDVATELAFVGHLATLPTPLRAYLPSDFSLNYTPEESEGVPLIEAKEAINARAIELGLPLTTVHNGIFEPFLLTPFSGIDLKTGTLSLYPGAENKPISITSPGYIGAAVAEIVQLPKLDKTYTVVEYAATGKEIAAALEEAGKKVTIEKWGDEGAAAAKASGPFGALSAAVRVKWGKGEWPEDDAYVPKAKKRDIKLAVQDALKA
ncbi:hypothetical protein CC85DRAFT_282196 [Cutaneotrichosporon oleaginosum]|uniref:NmrA-like domain-containing protein n=1 Tax=Cutaneotrichosporon oleaginosum TaxID=879819 RepID=A0A0J0XYE0_9TREE|nr:uncharacterized protein CC85DRAFT_282196 [Cutaneotrichosporon oleaginosum]KLT46058.1 hypothetical protein CC85DRAFT_282196 [Cutaneotrichosporon oleaginosum]TXT06751.1 hypothetical protein COLE_06082 [Cutaneotrichosporon oleaginosum]